MTKVIRNTHILTVIVGVCLLSGCGSLSVATKHGKIKIEPEKKPCVLDSDIECARQANINAMESR
mgnify:CR=1 FL=1